MRNVASDRQILQKVLAARLRFSLPADEAVCCYDHPTVRRSMTRITRVGRGELVARPRGTILQEHWRVAFRRRYFTSRRALQQTLDDFMRYYNHDRPHQGYRLRGQTPAALFAGAVTP